MEYVNDKIKILLDVSSKNGIISLGKRVFSWKLLELSLQ